MKPDLLEHARETARMTIVAHQLLEKKIAGCFHALGIQTVLVETARCVRQWMHARLFGLPGLKVELNDAPTDIYYATVPRQSAMFVMNQLTEAADLRTPGRGSIYAQDALEVSPYKLPHIEFDSSSSSSMPYDLTLITAILSMSGSGEKLARIALQLGAGVPVISLGVGTGIRDRLGLLRITISPEKELVHLMVPAHDADGLQRLLIEEGHLDRPGGGFIYQTPIRAGLADHLIRIGRQEHAASIEQIIAAIDDLKRGTAWRKRFFSMEPVFEKSKQSGDSYREISFVCADGQGEIFVQAAMRAGAGGATISRVRSLNVGDPSKGGNVIRERGIICVSADLEESVLAALYTVAKACTDLDWSLQSLEAVSVFSHKRT